MNDWYSPTGIYLFTTLLTSYLTNQKSSWVFLDTTYSFLEEKYPKKLQCKVINLENSKQ